MAGYVEVIAPVKGKGNFPAVESQHVGVGEKRLDEVLEKKVEKADGYGLISDAEKAQIAANKTEIAKKANADSVYSKTASSRFSPTPTCRASTAGKLPFPLTGAITSTYPAIVFPPLSFNYLHFSFPRKHVA